MGDFTIMQRTSDGYFEANTLLRQWNANSNSRKKQISEFLNSNRTFEFIAEIKNRESHERKNVNADFQVVINKKGKVTKNGRTPDEIYMHPYLFIDFAMWLNPSFKYDVIQFTSDQLIDFRKMAGDAYLELSTAIYSIVPKENMKNTMIEVGKALNYVVFNEHKKDIRNDFGIEKKQKELYDLEHLVATLINDGFIKSYEELIAYLRKQYTKRNLPKVFNDTAPGLPTKLH